MLWTEKDKTFERNYWKTTKNIFYSNCC